MDVSWPGLIIGLIITTACLFGFLKRDAFSKSVDSGIGTFIGDKAPKKLAGDPERTKAHLMLPIFGGIALGVAMIILSLTGAMA